MLKTEHLASLKLEGKIILALITSPLGLGDCPKRFIELKRLLNVSDPGLSKALRKLRAENIIVRDAQGLYYVSPEHRVRLGTFLQPLYSHYLLERMQLVAEELQNFNEIVALIVFGSVAQGKANYDSDIDLLVVTQKWEEQVEQRILEVISKLAIKVGVPVEPIVISTSGLNTLLQQELQFLFGLLQGYTFIYDKANIAKRLHAKKEELESKYEYYEEIPIWLPRVK